MRTSLTLLLLMFLPLPVQSADPPKRAKDLFGDPLPEGAVMRLGTSRLRATIESFGILADGTVVTIGPGNAVSTWNPNEDECDITIPLPLAGPETQSNPQVSPDGRYVASNTNVQVAVWERPVNQIKLVATFDIDKPHRLLFSPDGSKLAVSNRTERAERMSLCDIKSGKVVELAGEPNYFEAMAFSGNGKLLVGAEGYEVFVWDADTGKRLAQYKTGKVRYNSIALSPDGKLMAIHPTWGDKVVLVDPLTGKPVEGFIAPARGRGVAFAQDGKSLLIGDLNGITWWDHIAGKVIRRFEGMAHSGYGGPHPHERFTPDGKTLVATSGRVLLRWSASTGEPLFKAAVQGGHQYDVWAVGASADGKWFATGGHDKKVRVWDAATGKTVREFPSSWMNEKNVEFSKDGRFLYCPDIDRNTIVKWNVNTGEEVMRFAFKKDTPVQSLWAYCLTQDGKTMFAVSSGENRDGGKLVGWDVESGELRFQKPIDDPNLMMFPIGQISPDGKFFSGMFKLLSVDDPKKDLLPERKRGSNLPGTFSQDGKRILFTEGGREEGLKWLLCIYDIDSGKRLLEFPVQTHVTAAISPDGKTLAVAGAKDLSFHDAATGKEYARWNSQFINPHGEHNAFARTLQFTPDGKRVITAHNDTAPLVWSVPPRPGD